MAKKKNYIPPSGHREEVEEMERFRKIIENGFSNNPWDRVGGKPDYSSDESERLDEVHTPNGPDKDMARFVKLMEGMYDTAEDAATSLVEASISDPEIAEALETSVIKGGVKIGKWQIRVRTDESRGKAKKYFDVRHSVSRQIIAKNLCIYEAALALVRYLNKGKTINGPEIQKVLRLERDYHSYKIDALTHNINSLRAEKRKDYDKAFILETRFKEAAVKARRLEEEIRSLSKSSL